MNLGNNISDEIEVRSFISNFFKLCSLDLYNKTTIDESGIILDIDLSIDSRSRVVTSAVNKSKI